MRLRVGHARRGISWRYRWSSQCRSEQESRSGSLGRREAGYVRLFKSITCQSIQRSDCLCILVLGDGIAILSLAEQLIAITHGRKLKALRSGHRAIPQTCPTATDLIEIEQSLSPVQFPEGGSDQIIARACP